ncbi:Na(+)/H(+) antiporter subunit B [Fulvivirga ulvae]|uniref:MnhB domain-containing protein n=1 Tax=Fulvivirga ulvae TaxID=2904245 RepID=UPI001F43064F|nr:MnhB domain-containing protein [Fulvivirga ulvae]UII30594.1 Na(+)/H(+) antiporter subunit B [Fulvivirga ulvae]
MNSIILKITARYLKPVSIIFSIYVLLRGHNSPGGGFIAGLLAGSGILFYNLTYGIDAIRNTYVKPQTYLILGLVIILSSATMGFLFLKPLLTGIWHTLDLGFLELNLGTPLLFDAGIYLLVIGSLLTITSSIMEEIEWK